MGDPSCKRDCKPPGPGTHVEHGIPFPDVEKSEVADGGRSILAADTMIGCSTLVPGGGRVAVLPGAFRGARMDRFPEARSSR